MHRILAAALAASVCAPYAQAQARPPVSAQQELTLQQAQELAGAGAPGIDAADAGVRAAEAQRGVAALRPNPAFTLEVENVGGSGDYGGLRGAETTAGLSLPLELGGKRSARIAVADTQAARMRLALLVARADLRLRVAQAFVAASVSERRMQLAREQLEIADEDLRAARIRRRAGGTSRLEEQRADVARISAQTAIAQAERAAALAQDNLARLIGREPGALDLGWFDRIDTQPRQPGTAAHSLALAIAEADVAMADAQVRLARSQRAPDLTLSTGARRLEATNDVAAVFGLSLPMPLFNNGRLGVDVARAQKDQAEALRRLALLDAQQAIATAHADVADAQANARTATGPSLVAAQEEARIARIGYREGKFGQLDLLEAERTLAQTRAAAVDALAAYHDARARLERLTVHAPAETGVRP